VCVRCKLVYKLPEIDARTFRLVMLAPHASAYRKLNEMADSQNDKVQASVVTGSHVDSSAQYEDKQWKGVFSASDAVDNTHVDTEEKSFGVYQAVLGDIRKSVEQGFIGRKVGSQLSSLLYTLYELRKEEVVCTEASPGNNCILGFNALTVKDSEKFREDIANLLNIEEAYHGNTLDEQNQRSTACVYELLAAIGMIIQHRVQMQKVGGRVRGHDHLTSVEGMKFDAGVYASNRKGMAAGV